MSFDIPYHAVRVYFSNSKNHAKEIAEFLKKTREFDLDIKKAGEKLTESIPENFLDNEILLKGTVIGYNKKAGFYVSCYMDPANRAREIVTISSVTQQGREIDQISYFKMAYLREKEYALNLFYEFFAGTLESLKGMEAKNIEIRDRYRKLAGKNDEE